MIKINNIKMSIDQEENKLKNKVASILGVRCNTIIDLVILRRSLDARKKNNILFVYTVVVKVNVEERKLLNKGIKNISLYQQEEYTFEKAKRNKNVAVVGFGPCGMYAALCLSESGLNVDCFERGEDVDHRVKSVEKFWERGVLNTESNVQFGEGGAGTFSDGKLTARTKNKRIKKVMQEFVHAGAPKEIQYVHNPHIGTDKLRNVVKNIRKKIIELGAVIHFNRKVEGLIIENDTVIGVVVNGEKKYYDYVVLAVGHSARDTFEMLYESGVKITQKPFAVGFRIEHPQDVINKSQYKDNYNHPRLGPGEYKLAVKANNKGVYTFCMCPGGFVVPSQSEENTVVVNGMSEYNRDQANANSALLVTVNKEDIEGTHPLSGMHYQRELEKKAFLLGGSNYQAPAQLVKDFILNQTSVEIKEVIPSYQLGITLANLRTIYSESINLALVEGLKKMDAKLTNFALDDAVLTGVETRTSSPITINRDKLSMQSVNVAHLYPCGEGCGYAGGIVSAAIDGIMVSEQIILDINKEFNQ